MIDIFSTITSDLIELIADAIIEAVEDGQAERCEVPNNNRQILQLIEVCRSEATTGVTCDGMQWRVEDGYAIIEERSKWSDSVGELWVDITNGPMVAILGL